VVVGIDAETLSELDQRWPWARSRYASLIDRLHEADAKVIAIDIVFADPSEGDDRLTEAIWRPTTWSSVSSPCH